MCPLLNTDPQDKLLGILKLLLDRHSSLHKRNCSHPIAGHYTDLLDTQNNLPIVGRYDN